MRELLMNKLVLILLMIFSSPVYADILVRCNPGAANLQIAQSYGANVIQRYTIVEGLEHWKLPPNLDELTTVEELKTKPGVLYADLDRPLILATPAPNDSLFG